MEQLIKKAKRDDVTLGNSNIPVSRYVFTDYTLAKLLETAMRDAYNEARNQTPYIDFDDYFAQIKETLNK